MKPPSSQDPSFGGERYGFTMGKRQGQADEQLTVFKRIHPVLFLTTLSPLPSLVPLDLAVNQAVKNSWYLGYVIVPSISNGVTQEYLLNVADSSENVANLINEEHYISTCKYTFLFVTIYFLSCQISYWRNEKH